MDYLLRQQEFAKATEELGRVPKEQQADPLFHRYAERATRGLYKPGSAAPGSRGSLAKPPRVVKNRLRVTRHRKDADSRSDQSSDPEGLHVSERLEADVEGRSGVRGKFVLDLEGYKNGHNDLRYRTLLADFYRDDNHFAIGDSASYPSPYFLRGSRLRGLNVVLPGDHHQFQAVLGAYPFWLEERDEYIYPRAVFGARDKWILLDQRVQLAGGVIQTRDSGKIRTIDTANQIRDNIVYSLDQEIKLIPEVWYLKASEAWSYTDDDLNDNRFGDTDKLRDNSVTVESLLVQPWGQWISRLERTGPNFRLLTDVPSGAVINTKGLTSDRQLVEQSIDFKPIGLFDLDVKASWQRNNLDDRQDVELTYQSWYTADLGVLVPRGMPRPRVRTSMIETVSVPGPVSHPRQSRTWLIHPEISHFVGGWNLTGFTDYQSEIPLQDEAFSPREKRWAFGTRAATTFAQRITLSPYYTYRISDENVDVVRDLDLERLRVDTDRHETGLSTSYRLWDTASVGLSYDFITGSFPDYTSARRVHTSGHSGTASFTWPYTRRMDGNRRKFTLFPSLLFHLSDFNRDMGRRPLVTSRLTMGYEVFRSWKVELMGEFRHDDNDDFDNVHTEESRLWLLCSSEWK